MSSRLTPEILAALGLPSDVEQRALPRVSQTDDVGRGFSGLEPAKLESGLAIEIAQSPFFVPVVIPEMPWLGIESWKRDKRVRRFTVEGGDLKWLGKGESEGAGQALVDARSPAFVRITRGGEDVVLELEGFDINPIELTSQTVPADLRPLVQVHWQPETFAVVPPAMEVLTCGLRLEQWLLDESAALVSSAGALSRTAGVGLIARLWMPRDRAGRTLAQKRLASGEDVPSSLAIRWFQALDADMRDSIRRSAVGAAESLRDALPSLEESIADEHPQVATIARTWLRERDDLESVVFLIARGDPAPDVAAAVAELDEETSTYHSMWSELAPFDEPRFRAVAWQEPDAWWGQLT